MNKSFEQIIIIIESNGNWTEWSTIQGVIGRVISREADFDVTSKITPELYDTSPINRINNKSRGK